MFELVGFVAGLVSLLLEARHRMRERIQGIVVDRGLVIEQGIRGLGTGGRRGRSRVGIGQRGMAGGVFLVYNGLIARSYRHGGVYLICCIGVVVVVVVVKCRIVRKRRIYIQVKEQLISYPMLSHAARIHQLVWTDHRDLRDLQASLPVQRR